MVRRDREVDYWNDFHARERNSKEIYKVYGSSFFMSYNCLYEDYFKDLSIISGGESKWYDIMDLFFNGYILSIFI